MRRALLLTHSIQSEVCRMNHLQATPRLERGNDHDTTATSQPEHGGAGHQLTTFRVELQTSQTRASKQPTAEPVLRLLP